MIPSEPGPAQIPSPEDGWHCQSNQGAKGSHPSPGLGGGLCPCSTHPLLHVGTLLLRRGPVPVNVLLPKPPNLLPRLVGEEADDAKQDHQEEAADDGDGLGGRGARKRGRQLNPFQVSLPSPKFLRAKRGSLPPSEGTLGWCSKHTHTPARPPKPATEDKSGSPRPRGTCEVPGLSLPPCRSSHSCAVCPKVLNIPPLSPQDLFGGAGTLPCASPPRSLWGFQGTKKPLSCACYGNVRIWGGGSGCRAPRIPRGG